PLPLSASRDTACRHIQARSSTPALFSDPYFFAFAINGDVNDLGLRNGHDLSRIAEAFGFDDHVHVDGSIPDLRRFGVKAHEIAHKNRFVKNYLLHRHGHESVVLRFSDGLDRAGNVDVTEYDAAENSAVSVRVARHHRQPNSRVALF